MKIEIILSFAALAAAFVLPDANIFQELAINGKQQHVGASLWDKLPSREDAERAIDAAIGSVSEHIDDALDFVGEKFRDTIEELFDEQFDEDFLSLGKPHHGHHGHHGPHESNLTIYELISKSNYTTKFAKLVDEHESIVKLLNSTKANSTVFVPVDAAFEHIPEDKDKKPSKEFVEALLKYHIGEGLYPVRRILATHTLPTALEEKFLGGKPQRLRTSAGLFGVHINFYSKVIAANIAAKNGIIHGVNHILIPPPMVGRELSLFPSQFSTLLLAYEKTDFVEFIHGQKMIGSTVFAPNNGAFAKLGPRANAFLFNTEVGLKYLKALLKYHIVANSTLYSDELYRADSTDFSSSEHYHIDLPTLLDEKNVAVDIGRWGGWIRMKVNGYVPVVVQDGIAKNGVIQVVGRVLIPPHKHHKDGSQDEEGEIEVDDLKQRLAEFVEGDVQHGSSSEDL